MTPKDLIKHYGSQAAACRAIGYTRAAFQKWTKNGYVEPGAQVLFAQVTCGALTVSKMKIKKAG